MIVTSISVTGNHEHCEDCTLVAGNGTDPVVIHENSSEMNAAFPALLAVADGVGGLPGGRRASEFVLNELSSRRPPETHEAWEGIIRDINAKLITHAETADEGRYAAMATTLSLVHLTENSLVYAHTGNTRIQILNGIYLRRVTDDQTMYQWLLDTGNIEAAEKAPKNEIYSCMGAGNASNLKRIQTGTIPITDSQKAVIITSDGIHEYTDTDFLEDTLNRTDISTMKKAELIIEEALRNGSEDDMTIMIAEF